MENKKLFSDDEIIKNFSNRYILYNFYKNKYFYISIINYIVNNFKISKNLINKLSFKESIFSDADFYLEIRKYYNKNEKNIIKYHKDIYKNSVLKKKVSSIKNVLNHKKIKVKNVLDIGTEDTHFLDLMDKELYCNTIGLNIDLGYEHYFNKKKIDDRIIIYNGINFPFYKNQFDLVTLMAVVHHIKDLNIFFKNLCNITKLIYIKDQDVVNDEVFNSVKVQHELYEGILYPNKSSPLYKVSKNYIITLLKKNNFSIIYDISIDFITKPYILLASKNN